MDENKKFKVIEENAVDAPVKDIEWEGEHLQAESETKIQDDQGTGQQFIIRFFDFKANPGAFEEHIPTGQELFNAHRKGIESMLWADGLVPCEVIEPRILFAKNKSHYRFVVSCTPSIGNSVIEKTDTLTDIFNIKPNASL